MVGIKDIAKAANVSISTVSYALNDSPKVTASTRERILAIANEMNYIPNMAGRTLKRQKTNIIGIYLTDFGGSFYSSLLEGINKNLVKHGYDMIVCSGAKSHLFLPEKLIDGAIILDVTFLDKEIEQYAERGHQIVVLDRELEHKNICHVLLDNKAGATLALDYLSRQDLKKLYLMTGPEKTYDSDVRLATAKEELDRFGEVDYEIIVGDFTKSAGIEVAKKIVDEWQEPVGVFCFNDEMAIGMYDYLEQSDLKIGKDICIIGFDNSEVSKYLTPRLATIDYSMYKWGAIAANKIVNLLNKESVKDEIIYTSLIPGASVEP